MNWFDLYEDDFNEPPEYASLCQLQSFAQQYFTDSDFAQRCTERLATFRKRRERTAVVHG